MITLDVDFTPTGLLGAWRPRSGHLLLEVHRSPRLGSRVAARVHLAGSGLGATVVGSVASVLRGGTGHRIEFALGPSGLAAIRLLVSAAEGRAVLFRDRAPRLLARLPAVHRSAHGPVYMDTHSVSQDGCRLRWSGPAPDAGQPVTLRLGAGPLASNLDGVVRWVSAGQARAAVGVAFAAGAAQVGWLRWLEVVRDAGAPFL